MNRFQIYQQTEEQENKYPVPKPAKRKRKEPYKATFVRGDRHDDHWWMTPPQFAFKMVGGPEEKDPHFHARSWEEAQMIAERRSGIWNKSTNAIGLKVFLFTTLFALAPFVGLGFLITQ